MIADRDPFLEVLEHDDLAWSISLFATFSCDIGG